MTRWTLMNRWIAMGGVASLVGIVGAAASSIAGKDISPLAAFGLYAVAVGIPAAIGIYFTVWPTRKARREHLVAQESIESIWASRTESESFWTLAVLLIWMDLIGRVWGLVPWLNPLTFLHIMAAAAVSYGVNYLRVRTRES